MLTRRPGPSAQGLSAHRQLRDHVGYTGESPPDRAIDVPPTFFVEEPDPLPDREVAGYPQSVQFNPSTGEKVEMRGFSLYRESAVAQEPIGPTRLLGCISTAGTRLF